MLPKTISSVSFDSIALASGKQLPITIIRTINNPMEELFTLL